MSGRVVLNMKRKDAEVCLRALEDTNIGLSAEPLIVSKLKERLRKIMEKP